MAKLINSTSLRWHGHWVPSILTILILPCLLWLGDWQLGRAEEKRELLDALAEQAALPPLDGLPSATQLVSGRELRLRGSFDPLHRFFLDNRVVDGLVGYEVLDVFITESKELALVNRGWVSATTDRNHLPFLPVVKGKQEILVSIYQPLGDSIILKEELWPPAEQQSTWPLRIQSVDLERMSGYLGQPLFPNELRINPRDPAALTVRWVAVNMPPRRHQGYAITWFGLAATLLIAWLVASFEWVRK